MGIDNRSVGRRIKEIRLDRGESTADFAKNFTPEASNSLVSRWERGVNLPNANRLKTIAELGGISVNELLYGDVRTYIAKILSDNFSFDNINAQGLGEEPYSLNHAINMLLMFYKMDSEIYPSEEEIISSYKELVSDLQNSKDKNVYHLGHNIFKTKERLNKFVDNTKELNNLTKEQKDLINTIQLTNNSSSVLYENIFKMNIEHAYEEFNNTSND